MQFKDNLLEAKVVGKYNKLIVDVRLADDSPAVAFCPASDVSQMCSLGKSVWIKRLRQKSNRIPFEVVFVEDGGAMVFGCPNRNNDLFEEAFNAGNLPEFGSYVSCRRIEAGSPLLHSDFELTDDAGGKCCVYVTNIYRKLGGSAVFPTEVNFFELTLFEELRQLRAQGYATAVFMIVPRADCQDVKFSWAYAPLAAAKIYDEAKNGLKFVAYGCNIEKKCVTLSHLIPILY